MSEKQLQGYRVDYPPGLRGPGPPPSPSRGGAVVQLRPPTRAHLACRKEAPGCAPGPPAAPGCCRLRAAASMAAPPAGPSVPLPRAGNGLGWPDCRESKYPAPVRTGGRALGPRGAGQRRGRRGAGQETRRGSAGGGAGSARGRRGPMTVASQAVGGDRCRRARRVA